MSKMVGNPNIAEAQEKSLKSPNIGKRKKGKKTILKEKVNEEYVKEHIIRLAKSLPKISPKLII